LCFNQGASHSECNHAFRTAGAPGKATAHHCTCLQRSKHQAHFPGLRIVTLSSLLIVRLQFAEAPQRQISTDWEFGLGQFPGINLAVNTALGNAVAPGHTAFAQPSGVGLGRKNLPTSSFCLHLNAPVFARQKRSMRVELMLKFATKL
jgi:hypothetical protein